MVVSGAHDFNAWNQLFTVFARDYLWKPEAFLAGELGEVKSAVAATGLNKGNKNALTVKLDQTLKLVEKDKPADALSVLNGYITQVQGFAAGGKLTADESAALLQTAQKIATNLGFWS